MKYKFHKAVVIGAGTMGAAIAAHLANAGVPVTLLDIVPNKLLPEEEQRGLTLQDKSVRNRIVQQGLDRAIKSRPASFFTSVTSIAEGLSDGFRKHFLGTHFFNPPRYLKLLEVIPTKDTSPEVVSAISAFGEYRLGKGIVLCKDTPNFIANRLGFGSGSFALDYILKNGYTVDEVDAITGPAIGRPKTATFRLIDLVGVDVWERLGKNLAPAIPNDKHALRYLNS